MEKISFLNIFKAFFKIGVILLGGGYVIVPIVKTELIEKRNWLNKDELCDYYCVSQCLSGIIAMNMAILIGYKLSKLKGVIASVLGITFSPFVSIVLVALFLNQILNISFMKGIFWGVNLSVIVLIYLTVKDMWEKSLVDYFSWFWFIFILILTVLKISPIILIITSILLGFVIQLIKEKKNG